ncbi:MAG: hypothetical protein F2534_16620 [Actinobacteria bacterium]|nr:hypothetical protein [Actinomycetota bacterium]
MSDIFWTGLFTTLAGLGGAVVGAWLQGKTQQRQFSHELERLRLERENAAEDERRTIERSAALAALQESMEPLWNRGVGDEEEQLRAERLFNLLMQVDDVHLHVLAVANPNEVVDRLSYILRTPKHLRTDDGHLETSRRLKEFREAERLQLQATHRNRTEP